MNIATIPISPFSFSSSAVKNYCYYRSSFCCFSSSSTFSLIPKSLIFSSSYVNWKMPNFACFSSSIDFDSSMSDDVTTSSSDVTPIQQKPKPKPKPWLLVGLGNPGKKYSGTRHNVGFEMVDAIAEAEGISMNSVSFKALFGKGYIGKVPVILSKPQTFMNVSGESVGPLVSYYKIPLNQVLVIYDDLDLPFAKLRLLPKGGHGGHNGMRSLIDHFKGNRDFPRLRIGIGRPPGKMDAANFVLRPFSKCEREEVRSSLMLVGSRFNISSYHSCAFGFDNAYWTGSSADSFARRFQ
ncbi:peptidyl-tRNA hydrolase, mitochondrial isoform X3 [Beta vulgaris subsp. vulgaris]|uniref:peptidyl-tRNA hydrolase, mitochondrial isoform X3 n=1 Tax=Beta vulgaris subsp. vulgaris TaxID=3555 RepID=UPI0020375FF8|nr:peptidyl-tRNA hydrolase, mitochondrial isoform X3 [Beta vulgaris subsp. vulgaris]